MFLSVKKLSRVNCVAVFLVTLQYLVEYNALLSPYLLHVALANALLASVQLLLLLRLVFAQLTCFSTAAPH